MVTRASAVLAFLVGTSLLVACGSDRSGDEVHVVTLGDSVAFDADPGIRAALEAIGVSAVIVSNRSKSLAECKASCEASTHDSDYTCMGISWSQLRPGMTPSPATPC